MSALVIVGGGHDQAPTYVEARRAGLRTIGFDGRADAPCRTLADEFHAVDVRDADLIVGLLRRADVVGAVAPAVDRGLPTVRRVCLAFDLPCPISDTAAAASVDKTLFRNVIDRAGLPGYRSIELGPWTFAEVPAESHDVPLPAVVKPIDSSGSKGVSVVESLSDLEEAVLAAAVHSTGDKVLIEELLPGRHLTAEVFLSGGEIGVMILSHRIHTGPPGMITLAQQVPAALACDERSAIARAVVRIAAAVGLSDGPLNLDLVIGDDGTPRVIEMAARIGGNGLPRLVQLTTGVDTVRAGIDLALGETPDIDPVHDRAAVLLILATDHEGTVDTVRIPGSVVNHPAVADVDVVVEVGDRVRPYDRAANKLGYLTVVDDDNDPAAAARLVTSLSEQIEVDLVADDGTRLRCQWRLP